LRQGFSFAWRSLMGAEMILYAQHAGLGLLLHDAQDANSIAQVVAIMMVMVFIGMTTDRLAFARLERAVATRFGLAGG